MKQLILSLLLATAALTACGGGDPAVTDDSDVNALGQKRGTLKNNAWAI